MAAAAHLLCVHRVEADSIPSCVVTDYFSRGSSFCCSLSRVKYVVEKGEKNKNKASSRHFDNSVATVRNSALTN